MSRRPSLGALLTICATLASATPALAASDRFRSEQWGLDAINAPEAWAQADGTGVVVAVIDSGVEIDHPDLAGAIWTNPDETAANGVDDDGNGIVDDVHGANLIDDNADLTDVMGHGTPVAGIIAARANNGIGVAGVAPGAQIMPIRVCTDESACRMSAVVDGIRYAVDEGARIINISLGTDADSESMREAVAYAGAAGATIVNAAGNDARDIDAVPTFPSSLPDPAVVTVAATTEDGGLFSESNFGAVAVDIAAPGDMIATTGVRARYTLQAGTSEAAPFVAGALALLASARPEATQAELHAALLEGAAGGLAGRVATGRLDVGAAMHRLVPGEWGVATVAQAAGAGIAKLSLRGPRTARLGRRATLRWAAVAGVARWRVTVGRHSYSFAAAKRSVSVRAARPGRTRVTVVGLDAAGQTVASAARTLRAR